MAKDDPNPTIQSKESTNGTLVIVNKEDSKNKVKDKTKVISADLLDLYSDFEDTILFGNISVLVTFQFSLHFSFADISVLLTFQFW